MRLDFHNDKRLMQQNTGGISLDSANQETFTRLDTAFKNETDPAKKSANYQKLIDFSRRIGLLKAGTQASELLAGATATAGVKRATDSQEAGRLAGVGDINLQQQQKSTVIGMEQYASQTAFSFQTLGPMIESYVYGAACAFGKICNSPDLQKWGEDGMKAIQWPSINTAGVTGVSTDISPTGAVRDITSTGNSAISSLRDAAPGEQASIVAALRQQIDASSAAGGAGPAAANRGMDMATATSRTSELVTGKVFADAGQGRQFLSRVMAIAATDKDSVLDKGELPQVGTLIDQMIKDAAGRAKAREVFGITDRTAAAPGVSGTSGPALTLGGRV